MLIRDGVNWGGDGKCEHKVNGNYSSSCSYCISDGNTRGKQPTAEEAIEELNHYFSAI